MVNVLSEILPDYSIDQPNSLSINQKISRCKGETSKVLNVTQLERNQRATLLTVFFGLSSNAGIVSQKRVDLLLITATFITRE